MARAPFYEKKPLKKGTWSPDEDQMLKAYIKKYGIWNWSEMPGPAGLSRSGKSCRLRWMNYLRPDIKHGNFSREEEETILKLHEELGNKWSAIAARLPRRTDNEIKNYWHTHLKKCLKASLAPKTELQEAKTSSLEANQQNSSKIDLVLPNTPKATNSEDSYTTPLSSSSPAVYIDKNQALNEIIGSSGSLGELQSLWELSFPMEDLYLVEDSNASKATNSEDSYATPLSTSSPDFYIDKNQALNESICSFESLGVLQSSWEQSFPMEDYYVVEEYSNAPKATTSEDSYSTPLSTSSLDVCIDKSQASSEIIGSSESLGVLQSLWEHSFPAEDLFMVEDYGAKYTDPGFIAPFSPMWLQDPSNDFWVNCFMQENMNGI